MNELDRVQTAFVLACFAADEYGKHILVTSLPGRDLADDAEWNNFWRRFRLHEEKLGDALVQAWWDDLFDIGDPAPATDIHNARLRASYVDLSEDNITVLEPHEAVSRIELERLLEQLTRSIGRSETTFGETSSEQLAELMRRASESAEPRHLRDQIRAGSAAPFLSAAILQLRFLAEEVGEDLDEVERLVRAAWPAVSESCDEEGST